MRVSWCLARYHSAHHKITIAKETFAYAQGYIYILAIPPPLLPGGEGTIFVLSENREEFEGGL